MQPLLAINPTSPASACRTPSWSRLFSCSCHAQGIGYTTETAPDGTKRTVLDPHYAPMVQEGFRLYATGEYSYDALAAWSNSKGYVNLKGLPLNRYSWESILTNPAYMGYVSYKRRKGAGYELVRGDFEPLVSPELFKKVQEMRRERATSRVAKVPPQRHVYLLSGLAVCDQCGARMRGEPHNGIRYMADYGTRGSGWRQTGTKAEVLEHQVTDYLGEVKLPADYQAKIINALKAGKGQDDAQERRARLERSLRRLRDAYMIDDTMAEEEYREKVRQIKLELSRLRDSVETPGLQVGRVLFGALRGAAGEVTAGDEAEALSRGVSAGPSEGGAGGGPGAQTPLSALISARLAQPR